MKPWMSVILGVLVCAQFNVLIVVCYLVQIKQLHKGNDSWQRLKKRTSDLCVYNSMLTNDRSLASPSLC